MIRSLGVAFGVLAGLILGLLFFWFLGTAFLLLGVPFLGLLLGSTFSGFVSWVSFSGFDYWVFSSSGVSSSRSAFPGSFWVCFLAWDLGSGFDRRFQESGHGTGLEGNTWDFGFFSGRLDTEFGIHGVQEKAFKEGVQSMEFRVRRSDGVQSQGVWGHGVQS